MKLYKLLLLLLLIITLQGCSKEIKIADKMDFSAEDVTVLSVLENTPEDTQTLQVSDQVGIKEFLSLLQGIQIKSTLEDAEEKSAYYDYNLQLSEGLSFRLIDYGDQIKVINSKGDTEWYQTVTNTWDGLTPLWQKYASEETISPSIAPGEVLCKKPVIYLYPTAKRKVDVRLDLEGVLTFSYPSYNKGWSVIASPDGTLTDPMKGTNYSYLFWEGVTDASYDMSHGFVIKGEDVTSFLEEKLTYLGLNEKERNDFIVYWAPLLEKNPYNLITFQENEYTEKAKLSISPEPDTIQRIFMVYQPLSTYKEIPKQELTSWSRKGFSVVEWGGARYQ